jgi:putative DNA primase/helicase
LNPPPIVSAATDNYLAEEDARGRWVEDNCELDPAYFTPTERLWANWTFWAKLNNEFIGKRNDLLQYLEDERGLVREKRRMDGERHHGLVGIRLRSGIVGNPGF